MKYRRHLIALAIAAAATAAAHALVTVRLFDPLFGEAERKTVDYRLRSARQVQRDSADVTLILFDSSSVHGWPYLSPFPRGYLADLINTVSANGAAVIGLDVLLDRRYPELSQLDDGDERLRQAIADAGNVVLVSMTESRGGNVELIEPDPYFAEVAAAVGSADMVTPYETTRDARLITQTAWGPEPGFSLAMYAVMKGLDVDSLTRAITADAAAALPGLPSRYGRMTDGRLDMPILFQGPPSRVDREQGTFLAYTSTSIALVGVATMFQPIEAFQSWMQDKAVLLGSGWHDHERFRTPYYDFVFDDGEVAGYTYGVELHANALQNLLDRQFIRPLPAALTLLLLFGIALLASGGTFWRGAKWGILLPLLGLAGLGVVALVVFARTYTIVPLVSPTLAAVFAYTSAAAYVSIVEGREKRLIRGAFSKYVPAGVVDEVVADPSKLRLGGQKREVTILFSDMQGFTSLSESLPPEQLVSVLNEYLDEMTDILFDERGTLDKYIGDAVMAFWNAPQSVPDHALRGCRTALRMQRRLDELNADWRGRGGDWPELRVRIGLNTGEPVIGNTGGESRFNYTALGDAVNLAARLEPACKSYGISIMIAQPTREQAGDAIVVRELDMLAVYGKAEPVRVYELVALGGEPLDDATREMLDHYTNGLAAYRRRDFELAISYFDAALAARPGDGPSQLYRDRSEDYMLNPPPADWDFVERRQVK